MRRGDIGRGAGALGAGTAGEAAAGRPECAKLVVLLGALSAFGPLSLDMYLPGLPALRRDLETGASQAQLTLSACSGWRSAS